MNAATQYKSNKAFHRSAHLDLVRQTVLQESTTRWRHFSILPLPSTSQGTCGPLFVFPISSSLQGERCCICCMFTGWVQTGRKAVFAPRLVINVFICCTYAQTLNVDVFLFPGCFLGWRVSILTKCASGLHFPFSSSPFNLGIPPSPLLFLRCSGFLVNSENWAVEAHESPIKHALGLTKVAPTPVHLVLYSMCASRLITDLIGWMCVSECVDATACVDGLVV